MVIVGRDLEELAKAIGDDLSVSGDAIDLHIESEGTLLRNAAESKINLREGEEFKLLPGELFLVYTKEVVNLPNNVMGLVNLRSRYARKGFIQSTSLKVSPGFRGKILLELSVITPAVLKPGDKLAQLILLRTSTDYSYEGVYQNQGL